MKPSTYRRTLTLIVLAGLLARGVLLAGPLRSGSLEDPDNYLPLARSLAEGRGFVWNGRPTAYRPPLYPIVLAPIVAALDRREAWGVAALHLALGAGTVLLTASAARRWGLSPSRALAAAAIVSLDPVLVAQSRSVMTETLAAFLAVAALDALALTGLSCAAVGGLAFGFGALCRPTALAPAALTAVAAIAVRPGPIGRRLGFAAVIAAATAAPLVPWAVRNAVTLGAPVFTTTHGGYTLYLANNPVYYDEVVNGPPGAVWTGRNQWLWWDKVNHTDWGDGEPAADRAMRREALRVIASRPADFARASAGRLARFWGLAPAEAVYPVPLRLLSAAWTAPFWVALGLGFLDRANWSWPRVAAPVFILGISLVHVFYWTDLRMRAPAVPAAALAAAAALSGSRNARNAESSSGEEIAQKKSKFSKDSAVQNRGNR